MEGGGEGGRSVGATLTSTSASSLKGDEGVVFPPPSLWYKSTVVSARDDMWAYSGGGLIVVVKPPLMRPKVMEVPAEVNVDEVSEAVGDMKLEEVRGNRNGSWRSGHVPEEFVHKRRWPMFSLMGEQRNRYSCLSFCQSPMNSLPVPGATLATGCDGGVVQIWNVEEKKSVYYHDAHQTQIAGLDWSTRNPMLIYSIDDGGTLVVWNVSSNKLRTMNFGKVVPSCLQACPSEDNVVAFGTRGGNIFVVNTLSNGTILSKVRHEEEVVVVMWKPEGRWDWLEERDSHSSQHILASGTHSVKSSTIRIWNSRGKDLGVIKMSETETNKFRQYKSFVPVAWLKNPNTGKLMLASSNRFGEICYSENRNGPLVCHGSHQHNAIFAIVQCGDIMWSLSFEPVLVGYNLRRQEIECIVPTFKGCTSILPSPVDCNRVAVGGADSFIRVLRCSPGFPMHGEGVVKSPVISQKLKGKVVCITWHPMKDNCIAFGTDEGTLGLFEVGSEQKHVSLFERHVHGVVYTVRFGPQVYTAEYQRDMEAKGDKSQSAGKGTKEHFVLYACGNGGVFMVHTSKLSNPLIDVLKIIHKANPAVEITGLEVNKGPHVKATDILWTPDYSLFAVGFSDGRIELYSPPFLKLKCWIKCHTRAIQYLAWRPYDFSPGQMVNNSDKWLVSASNDGTIRLHNLKDLFEKEVDDESVEPKMVISSEATLSEHSQRVISCAWSPHDVKLFVTVSYDATAIVWNVEDGSHIARYMEHQQRLVACCFHPTHPFQVITASDELERDFAIQIWDYRDHPFRKNVTRSKPPCVAVPIKAANEVSKILSSIQEKKAVLSGVSVKGSDSQKVKSSVSNPVRVITGAEDVKKAKKLKSLMPATAQSLNYSPHANFLNEIQYLVEGKPLISSEIPPPSDDNKPAVENQDKEMESNENCKSTDPTLHLGLLQNREKCRKQVEFERNKLEAKNPDGAAVLSFWLEDSSYIEKCIKSGQVTESMIVIAASHGRSLYLKAVESYASSLLQDQDYLNAGHYFYLCGKHDKAVDVLVSGKHFREAVALVKSTLPEEDPRVKDVMDKWAKHLFANGNFEVATKIYCSIHEYASALSVIEKRPHAFAYKTGCYIAEKMKDESKLTMFGVLFVLDGLPKEAYEECSSLLKTYPHLKWLETIVKSHETLTGYVKYLNEVRDAKAYRLWSMVLENCWAVLQTSFQSYVASYECATDLKKKITECISVSIPQNQHEAMLIITKFITLKLLGMLDSDVYVKALEAARLAKIWISNKNVCLYFATVSTICSLTFPSLETMPEKSTELCDIFLDASVMYLKISVLKTEILNPSKAEEMKAMYDGLFQGPFARFKETFVRKDLSGQEAEEILAISAGGIPQSVSIDISKKTVQEKTEAENLSDATADKSEKKDEVVAD